MISDKQYYLDIFKVGDTDLQKLTETALSHGGDYCDLYFENTMNQTHQLIDGEVSSGGLNIDYGVGIRVLCGEKTGYAYSESTTWKDMESAAIAASAISQGTAVTPRDTRSIGATYTAQKNNGDRLVRRLYPGRPNPAADRYPIINDWRQESPSVAVGFLGKLEQAIKSRDSRITSVICALSSQTSDYLMYNSFGEMKYETRPMTTVQAMLVADNGSRKIQKNVSRSLRKGAEMLTDALITELAGKITDGLDNAFEAVRPKGGQMQVVMGAGASGILLHEAMGHAFEADFNRKGQSIFSDKMGKRVCPEGINIVDDATIRGNRGSLNFDDEGVPGQRTTMVEDGILTSYLHDRISARYYSVAPTGNGRRETFRSSPIPRMRATYMESGNAEPDGIIASVRKGIYVNEFSNGQVKIGEGDFTFFVKSGFLIEDGRLTRPIKDINVIGNGPQALKDIMAVGNDCVIDDSAWTCGKGQSVSVSCGMPTVLVNNLLVGGEQDGRNKDCRPERGTRGRGRRIGGSSDIGQGQDGNLRPSGRGTRQHPPDRRQGIDLQGICRREIRRLLHQQAGREQYTRLAGESRAERADARARPVQETAGEGRYCQ